MKDSVRLRSLGDLQGNVPVHVVWELTLACNLKCQHCGSRAGKKRPEELNTEEALSVIDQLAALGTREITLIGGEAFLRKDWLTLVARISGHGIRCLMQTGGSHLTRARLEDAKAAGLLGIGVSIDGPEEMHDRLRGVKGSYSSAFAALREAKALGMGTSANTQIGPETIDRLPELMERLIEAGATHWQLQITVAMGNAVDNDHLLMQPFEVLRLMPLLDRLYESGRQRGFLITFGNNLGYFGPFEHRWRGLGDDRLHWTGCAAGQNVIGLEADGTIKGCPSLETREFGGGNVRDATVADLWNNSEPLHFGRLRSIDALWGHCRTCYYADVCRGGCTWTSHSLFGKAGNNPYCHHRALELERQGLRERVVKVEDAPKEAFAIGRFALIEEAIPGRVVTPAPARPAPRVFARSKARPVPRMTPCRSCHQYIWPDEVRCPHCSADVAVAAAAHAEKSARRKALISRIEGLLGDFRRLTSSPPPRPPSPVEPG